MSLAIETRGLTKDFKSVRAVDNLDLAVPTGSIFGFLGPNGAGKTTTIHLLLGLTRPTSGTASVLGLDVATHADEVRARCGALLEHHGLYERMTAESNLEFFARIYRLPQAERASRIKQVLDDLGLWDRRHDNVGTWSRGMKQKLAIARTLLHRPPLVFLDEPTAGHDPAAARELRETLKAIVKAEHVTFFLTTHNLTEAEILCSHVAILRKGRLIESGPPAELRSRAGRHRLELRGTKFTPVLMRAIKGRPEVAGASIDGDRLQIDLSGPHPVHGLVALAVKHGAHIEEVRKGAASLEDAFIDLVQE